MPATLTPLDTLAALMRAPGSPFRLPLSML